MKFNIFKRKNKQEDLEEIKILNAKDAYKKSLENKEIQELLELNGYRSYVKERFDNIHNEINKNTKNGSFDLGTKINYIYKRHDDSREVIKEMISSQLLDLGYKVRTYEEEVDYKYGMVIRISWNK